MFLKKLQLRQFRNYEQADLEITQPVNLFVGDNAQGKTNILEAIYVLAMTKSHRANHDRELIRWQADFASISAQIEKKYGDCELQLAFAKQGKKAKINGLGQKKLSDYIGHLNVVLFAPEDLDLIKGSPGMRRRFIDMEIGQIQTGYLYHLAQFQRALDQKNNLLRSLQVKQVKQDDLLTLWNEQMAAHAVRVIKKRKFFIEKLKIWAALIHSGITNGSEQLELTYQCSLPPLDDSDESVVIHDYMLKLEQLQEKEIRRGSAVAGPQRDDLSFSINGKDVQTYGSQGQQRTAALSIKLAEIDLIYELVGEYPLLLLDDVLSELDRKRQIQLIETFQEKVQTFITTADLSGIHMEKMKQVEVFWVKEGTILKEEP